MYTVRPPALKLLARIATEEPNERTLGAAVVVGRSHGNVRRLELDAVLGGQQAHVRRVTYRRDESQPASPSAAARMQRQTRSARRPARQRPRHPPGFWPEPKPERPLHPPGLDSGLNIIQARRRRRDLAGRAGGELVTVTHATTRFGRARASRAVNWT
jgi:hypothetical protein